MQKTAFSHCELQRLKYEPELELESEFVQLLHEAILHEATAQSRWRRGDGAHSNPKLNQQLNQQLKSSASRLVVSQQVGCQASRLSREAAG